MALLSAETANSNPPASGGEPLQDDELLGFCILLLLAPMASGITPGTASSPLIARMPS